jgi:predicted RNase H-like HicB family nuclease
VKYEVLIYWSEPDDAFIAEVPELPGCMTHGATYQQAAANVEEAMQGWLKAWTELGREIPKPRQRALAG